MTAEEYIKNNTQTPYILMQETLGYEHCVLNEIAYKSIEMSRNQEREKAMSAFDEVITYALLRRSEGERMSIGIMKEQFKKLLNK